MITPDLDLLSPLLTLQGDIKVYLMANGLSQDNAHDYAATILDKIARSGVTRPELAAAYAALSDPFL